MCTIIVLHRPKNPWPLLIAANRDEMAGRPWRSPGRYWSDRPEVVGGLDELAGGTWLGMNDTGVVAAVLNRHGTLGPAEGKRSRGELPLEALDHADAADAVDALAHLDGRAWRAFNMVVADNRDAFWVRSSGAARVEVRRLPPGLSMLTSGEVDDPADPRIARFLPLFRDAAPPEPDSGDWSAWQALLGAADGAEGALTFRRPDGFGTVCSTLLALPAIDRPEVVPVLLFAPGSPDSVAFQAVSLRPIPPGDAGQ
jgi:hypothetical protein